MDGLVLAAHCRLAGRANPGREFDYGAFATGFARAATVGGPYHALVRQPGPTGEGNIAAKR